MAVVQSRAACERALMWSCMCGQKLVLWLRADHLIVGGGRVENCLWMQALCVYIVAATTLAAPTSWKLTTGLIMLVVGRAESEDPVDRWGGAGGGDGADRSRTEVLPLPLAVSVEPSRPLSPLLGIPASDAARKDGEERARAGRVEVRRGEEGGQALLPGVIPSPRGAGAGSDAERVVGGEGVSQEEGRREEGEEAPPPLPDEL
eukprot:1242419-Rhodomonas_salina.8